MTNQTAKKNTVVVNLFAGPGAGKSTCAWEIASKLKKLGYVAEYVSEYAKDLVWDERFDLLDGTVEHQTMLLKEQKHRQDRLMGKVDFIVTDSPTILSTQYLKEDAPDFVKNCIDEYKSHNNFSIYIQRGKTYEQVGRIQTEEQARLLDEKIKDMLKVNNIYFGTYTYETIDLSIKNMIYTYNRTNNLSQNSKQNSADKITQEGSSKKYHKSGGSPLPSKTNKNHDWYAVIYNDQGTCTGFALSKTDFKNDFFEDCADEYAESIINKANENSWEQFYYRSDRTVEFIKAESKEAAVERLRTENVYIPEADNVANVTTENQNGLTEIEAEI